MLVIKPKYPKYSKIKPKSRFRERPSPASPEHTCFKLPFPHPAGATETSLPSNDCRNLVWLMVVIVPGRHIRSQASIDLKPQSRQGVLGYVGMPLAPTGGDVSYELLTPDTPSRTHSFSRNWSPWVSDITKASGQHARRLKKMDRHLLIKTLKHGKSQDVSSMMAAFAMPAWSSLAPYVSTYLPSYIHQVGTFRWLQTLHLSPWICLRGAFKTCNEFPVDSPLIVD